MSCQNDNNSNSGGQEQWHIQFEAIGIGGLKLSSVSLLTITLSRLTLEMLMTTDSWKP